MAGVRTGMTLNDQQRSAVVAIATFAARADGLKTDTERAELRRAAESIDAERGVTDAVGRVLSGATTLEAEARTMDTPETRTLAYELAVCMVDCDGAATDSEKRFLETLAGLLQIDRGAATAIVKQADAIVAVDDLLAPAAAAGAAVAGAVAGDRAGAGAANPALDRELDDTILNHAILCGALELLPQSLASLAIVPIQTRMVYSIGSKHGYSLGLGHMKEFLATIGLGVGGQMLEGVARRYLGGLAKRFLGGMGERAVTAAAGGGMTFVSTWAIGQVARSYYGNGRRLSADALRSLYSRKCEEAQSLYQQYGAQIQQRASGLDLSQLSSLVRGVGR